MSDYRHHNAYSGVNESDPFVIEARQDISDYISVLLTNNCKLLKYYGLSVSSQLELVYVANGIKLNKHTLYKLKTQAYKTCNFRLLGYIAKFWGLPLSILFNPNMEVKEVLPIIVFPSFVVLKGSKV